MIAILSNLAKVRKLVDKTCHHLNQHNSIHSSINKKNAAGMFLFYTICDYSNKSYGNQIQTFQDLNPFTALSSLSKGNSPDCLQSCCPFLKRIKVGVDSTV